MRLDDAPELQELLQPVAPEDPCGPSLRQDPLFVEIRLARQEDDPNLPMGQWERPLKQADWAAIARDCGQALASRSKDLQLAAWLLEAWTRQDGLAGLSRGLLVMRELLGLYWEQLHPRIDDEGDVDARVASLVWLDHSLPTTLRVHVPLVPLSGRRQGGLSLALWEQLVAQELSGSKEKPAPEGDAPLTRETAIEDVRQHAGPAAAQQLRLARECREQVEQLSHWLSSRLERDAPGLARLQATLAAIERVLVQLQAPVQMPTQPEPLPVLTADAPPPPSEPTVAPVRVQAAWSSREEAYQTLEALALRLRQLEPHSPTPWLIHRALRWGRMPLPELMTELMRKEGEFGRLLNLLGLKPPAAHDD